MTIVVITRPAAQASALAQRVVTAGFEPLVFPAIAITPADDPRPLVEALAHLERYRLVIFVSPNAIAHALAHLQGPWPSALPIGVMGPGSLETLASHGIAAPNYRLYSPLQQSGPAQTGVQRFDSESLLKQLDVDVLRGGTVLIVKGNGGRPWLAERLMELGIMVEQVESYRRQRHLPDAEQKAAIRKLIAQNERTIWVVTSSEAIDDLIQSLDEMGGPPAVAWLKACRWIVPHQRIAENATARGVLELVLSGPGDARIVDALK